MEHSIVVLSVSRANGVGYYAGFSDYSRITAAYYCHRAVFPSPLACILWGFVLSLITLRACCAL